VVRSFGLLALEAAAVVAAAIGIGALLARRLSRPVEDLGSWARTLGNRTRRNPPEHSGIIELDQLRDTMADADERIRELLQRERSFSSHVAHQLRTPVAALRVAIEAELDAPRPDPTAVLHESLGAVDRLESTISSMLALARHDERTPSWCDVTRLVAEHVDRWTPMFAAAGRDLSTRGSIVAGLIDPATVRHVLDVLLDNALAHGDGRVSVSIGSVDGLIEIDVADEGHASREADPFSEQRSDTGHGIGLRLARTLAESDGGELSLVESRATVFRLTLPVDRQGEPVTEDA
jgi:signal transduction histidine kinase